jgi:hypothetical protein
MPRGRDLTDFERGRIYALRFDANWTVSRISRRLQIGLSAVSKYCQRVVVKEMDGTPVVTDRKGKCGRHECTTVRDNRRFVRIALGNRFLTAVAVARMTNNEVNCSIRTVRRRLTKGSLNAYSPAHKTALSDRHKDLRLRWSVEHLDWNDRQWHRVLFSDESKFIINQYHVQYVRRRIGERYAENCVEPQANRGIGSVMVWAGFSCFGFTDIAIINGRLTAEDYVDVLRLHLLPNYRDLLPPNGLFMQDNAPIHSARVTTAFLRENNIDVLPWPPMSPDLNPIEHVWSICKKELRNHPVHNVPEMIDAIRHVWENKMNNVQFRVHLIDSMRRRVRAVHISRGSYTRY